MKKEKKSSVMNKLLLQTRQDKGKAYTGLISIIVGTLLLSVIEINECIRIGREH